MDYNAEVQSRIDECRAQQTAKLDLSNLALTEVPEEVFTLTHLTELRLGDWNTKHPARNRISTLPEAITCLQNLSRLSLRNNQLSTLPDAVTKLQNLSRLSLRNNQLSTLPETITRLQNLSELELGNNQLSTLPDAITRLQNLTSLYLSNNQLRMLSDAITRLQNLTSLDLSNNQLGMLPDAITRLQNLTRLYFSHNQLGMLSDTISRLQNLSRLDLDSNHLSMLPDAITCLQKLTHLGLNNNQLSTLPDGITKLQNLTLLYLSHNQLSTLPHAVTCLQNLTHLGLNNNQLSTLPDAIIKLQNLTHLYLSHNQLSTLPHALVKLRKVKDTKFDNNPLLNPPLEIATRGMKAIRGYFAKFGEIDHLYEAKLLLVGEPEVGKSSLKKALTVAGFQLRPDEKSTEGIDVQRWVIPGAELGLDKDFQLNLWDFGGQEIYHATHQFFLTRRSLYLLVTESRKEDQREDFYYWLNIVRLLGGHSPVILVLNKIDERRKELPYSQLQQSFANLVDYQAVSCATGYTATIDALKEAIRRVLRDPQRMNHINAPLPAAWVAIRNELEVLRRDEHKDYLSNDDYLALCLRHELNETIANVLSDYLHDLGVFLHFRESVALCDTIFLNHRWVTDAVYKVLDDAQVKARYGEFNDRDLLHLWQDVAYRSQRPALLALMEQFELCYRLPGGGYLAPQLLPQDEPATLAALWPSDPATLRFEFRYTFMPKGILPRFIVREHRYIQQRTHWRYGVLLAWGNTRALVRDHYYAAQKKITVTLAGDNQKGFLEIIRKSVQEIHHTFHGLAVEEWVPCNCALCQAAKQPEFFKVERLEHYQRGGKPTITCDRSLHEVNIQRLLNAVFLPPKRGEEEEEWRDELLARGGTYVDRRIMAGGSVTVTEIGDNAEHVAVGSEIEQWGNER